MNARIILSALVMAASSATIHAQDCYVPIAIYFDDQMGSVPESAVNMLENSLTRIATASDFEAGLGMSQFVLTARADITDKNVTPGPPIQTATNLGVTLFIADTYSQTKFASTYLELTGVGTNETKAYINAFRQLNANQRQVQTLMQNGRRKIIGFYDQNYHSILADAERQFALQNYEAAIALAVSVPPCSQGGVEAQTVGLKYYKHYRDRQALELLNRARSIWNASQNAAAAREAGMLIAQIDPEATCYKDALSLAEQMRKQVRSDIDFHMREKYHDQVALRKAEIEAMRAVGVAYGRGQRPTTTNLMWLR